MSCSFGGLFQLLSSPSLFPYGVPRASSQVYIYIVVIQVIPIEANKLDGDHSVSFSWLQAQHLMWHPINIYSAND